MKKKIPLEILEILQPVTNENLQYIEPVNNPEVIFHLRDKDPHSNFYFKVVKQESKDQYIGYYLDFKPHSKTDMASHKPWLRVESIVNEVQKWIDIIAAYNKIHTIYDDPILISYQHTFEQQFKVDDMVQNNVPLKLEELIFLDDYMEGVQRKLITLKEGRPVEEINELSIMENEAVDIRKGLSTQTKKVILSKLCQLWARGQKLGVDVIRDIFVSVASDLLKKLITGG